MRERLEAKRRLMDSASDEKLVSLKHHAATIALGLNMSIYHPSFASQSAMKCQPSRSISPDM